MQSSIDQLRDCLMTIKDQFGLEVFEQEQRLNGLIGDLAPELVRERKMIQKIGRVGIIDSYLEALRTKQNPRLVQKKARTLLIEEEFIVPEIAESYLSMLECVFGMRTTKAPAQMKQNRKKQEKRKEQEEKAKEEKSVQEEAKFVKTQKKSEPSANSPSSSKSAKQTAAPKAQQKTVSSSPAASQPAPPPTPINYPAPPDALLESLGGMENLVGRIQKSASGLKFSVYNLSIIDQNKIKRFGFDIKIKARSVELSHQEPIEDLFKALDALTGQSAPKAQVQTKRYAPKAQLNVNPKNQKPQRTPQRRPAQASRQTQQANRSQSARQNTARTPARRNQSSTQSYRNYPQRSTPQVQGFPNATSGMSDEMIRQIQLAAEAIVQANQQKARQQSYTKAVPNSAPALPSSSATGYTRSASVSKGINEPVYSPFKSRNEGYSSVDLRAAAVVYGVGGAGNVKGEIDSCISRMKIHLHDKSRIHRGILQKTGAIGIVDLYDGVAVVYGPAVLNLANKVRQFLRSGIQPESVLMGTEYQNFLY